MSVDNNNLMDVMWQPSDTIALAISGGIDSMVLYHMLTTHYENTYHQLVLLHVNHGLRAQSAEEEKHIIQLGERNGHKVEVKHLAMSDGFSQAKARELRYEFFKIQCDAYDAVAVLTAHHRDDHHETILHQLLTGRHLNRTLGIRASGEVGDLPVMRPMLPMSKEMVKDYQEKHQVHYFEDETNAADDYTRNYIRHHLIADIRKNEHLHEDSLTEMAEDMDEMKELAHIRALEVIRQSPRGTLSRSAFEEEPRIIKVFILREWLGLHGIRAGRKFIEELISVIHGESPQGELYVGDKIIKLRYDELFVENNSGNNVKLIDGEILMTENGLHRFNGYRIELDLPDEMLPLTVRTKRDGDAMQLPNLGTKKLSRIFIDNKIPKEKRKKIPVIVDKDREIIALGTIYNIIEPQRNYNGLNISKEKTHEFEE